MRTCAAIVSVVAIFLACAGGGVQVSPPAPEPPATLPAGPGGDAVKKLLAAKDGLTLSLDKDAKPDQYLVRGTLQPGPVNGDKGEIQTNPLSYVFGRDKDKAVFVLYATETGVPLVYSTPGFSVLVSTTSPGKLELHNGSPQVTLVGVVEKKTFSFDFGLASEAKFNVDMRSFVESFSQAVREAALADDKILLRLENTRQQIDLPAKTDKTGFLIKGVHVYAADAAAKVPLFSVEFQMAAPAAEFFKARAEDVKKLQVDEVKEVGNLGRVFSAVQFGGYLMGDLGKDAKMLAAAKELAKLVPAMPPASAPQPGPGR